VPEHWAIRLTGHKTTEVFRRYTITIESDLRDAVAQHHKPTDVNDRKVDANAGS
jgi:hypothetical protein